MTKFREHRGSLDKSMETCIKCSSKQELIEYLKICFSDWLESMPPLEDIIIEKYGFDNRINWDTHIVYLEGYGVIGMTDGPE